MFQTTTSVTGMGGNVVKKYKVFQNLDFNNLILPGEKLDPR